MEPSEPPLDPLLQAQQLSPYLFSKLILVLKASLSLLQNSLGLLSFFVLFTMGIYMGG